MSEKRFQIKKKIIELEYEAKSLDCRLKDLQWMIEQGEEDDRLEQQRTERRMCLDKIKHIYRNVADLKTRLLEE